MTAFLKETGGSTGIIAPSAVIGKTALVTAGGLPATNDLDAGDLAAAAIGNLAATAPGCWRNNSETEFEDTAVYE